MQQSNIYVIYVSTNNIPFFNLWFNLWEPMRASFHLQLQNSVAMLVVNNVHYIKVAGSVINAATALGKA